MRLGILGLAAAALLALAAAAEAAQVTIVALGASNTYGSGRRGGGVSPGEAWPAQLERLLRARGLDATVKNEGVPGDTTSGMLSRLSSAVPEGTKVVVLQPGGNDARRGGGDERAGNIGEIKRRLAARHIRVVVLGPLKRIAPPATHDPDGQHFNAQGHAALAAYLAPKVMAAAR